MIAFAVGGLLGDVFFHTLPHMNAKGHGESHSHAHEDHTHESHDHAHEGHEHSHDPQEMQNNMIIIIGILTFFIIEKVSIRWNIRMGHWYNKRTDIKITQQIDIQFDNSH